MVHCQKQSCQVLNSTFTAEWACDRKNNIFITKGNKHCFTGGYIICLNTEKRCQCDNRTVPFKSKTTFNFLTTGVSLQVHPFKQFNLNKTKCSRKQRPLSMGCATSLPFVNGFECHLIKMCIESLVNNESRCTLICPIQSVLGVHSLIV